jgi:adenine-specific DNA-methyltransferase
MGSNGKGWEEWEIPRELPPNPSVPYLPSVLSLHQQWWWSARIFRQQEIDKSIAAKADSEFLYDNKKCVRVAGPFTVESLSPHRVLGVDEDDELIDKLSDDIAAYSAIRRKSFLAPQRGSAMPAQGIALG